MRRDALTRPCPTQDPLFPHGVNGNRDALAVISDSLPQYRPLGGPCRCGILDVSCWYGTSPPGSASQHITQHGVFHGTPLCVRPTSAYRPPPKGTRKNVCLLAASRAYQLITSGAACWACDFPVTTFSILVLY